MSVEARDDLDWRSGVKYGAAADSSPHEMALAEYADAIRDATRLNQLFAILAEPAPLTTVVDRVLVTLSELFAADVVVLLQPNQPHDLVPIGSIGLPEDVPTSQFPRTPDSCAGRAIATRAPTLCGSSSDLPRDCPLLPLGVETTAWLPVLGSQDVLGVLVLGRCQPLPFSRSDADLLMAMAYRIGLVLERARAEEERRRLESRLRQAEKAESLGRMAAAVAHHFNNKLTAVMGHLDLALDDLATSREDARIEISRAQEATRQASEVGQLMLAYLGQSVHRRETLDLVAECRQALVDIARRLPVRASVRADLPPLGVSVRTSPADVRQILTNLLTNAAEAMVGRDGEIVVTIREVPAEEAVPSPLLAHGWTPRAHAYACLEVSDTGCGMDSQTLRNAFDPFFTTKFTGRGLGLPVVLGLVRGSDGTVTVESEKGRGTTFRVFLPLRPTALHAVPR